MAGTPSPTTVSTKLQRIATLAREAPELVFTTLAHHIDVAFLKEAYRRTRKGVVYAMVPIFYDAFDQPILAADGIITVATSYGIPSDLAQDMSTELDIYEYRAALLEWHQENVGQVQLIFVAEDSHALLQEIRDDVLRYANSLTHHYAQLIDTIDLSSIQRHFSSDELLDRVWNHEDIQRLLRDLIREKLTTLATYGRYQSVLGEWHDLIEWVNDLLPARNHVLASIEDSVPNFVCRLWDKYFDVETVYRREQSPQDVIWLGKLALLRMGSHWWERTDGMHFFYELVDEHNELFGFY